MYTLFDQSSNLWVIVLFIGLPVAGLLAIAGYLWWRIDEDTREETRIH